MFWSDVGGDTHRIMRAYMDGTNETVFVANAANAASKSVLNKGPPPTHTCTHTHTLIHTHTHIYTHVRTRMHGHTKHIHFSIVNKTDEASQECFLAKNLNIVLLKLFKVGVG